MEQEEINRQFLDDLCQKVSVGTLRDTARQRGYDPCKYNAKENQLFEVLLEFAHLWPKDFIPKGRGHSDRYSIEAGTPMAFIHHLNFRTDNIWRKLTRRHCSCGIAVPKQWWNMVEARCKELGLRIYTKY